MTVCDSCKELCNGPGPFCDECEFEMRPEHDYEEYITELQQQLKQAREVIEFYADTKKMYDCAYDNDSRPIGYVRGVDPYDSLESDFEKVEGKRTLHHGKRAREWLEKNK